MNRTCALSGCDTPPKARGLCPAHYKRWRTTGTTVARGQYWQLIPAAEPVEFIHGSTILPPRIWDKITVTESGCWRWDGARYKAGYGRAQVGREAWNAHRLVYTAFVGPIPDGQVLDHHLFPDGGCLGPPCVIHTRPVTPRENTLRGSGPSAANRAVQQCPQGHPYAGANLYIRPNGSRECRKCSRLRIKNGWNRRVSEARAAARRQAE